MNGIDGFLWSIFPYMVGTFFTVALLYRAQTNRFGWTSKSSQFLEERWLRWGSLLFHWGILFVLAGHVAGLLIPVEWYRSLGVTDELYHAVAVGAGGVAGTAAGTGAVILLIRRLFHRRIQVTSGAGDLLSILALTLVILAGMTATFQNGMSPTGFDYRETISPWLRGIFLFQPDPSLMQTVPLAFKVHILAAFGLLILWPFTRLVHAFSFPVQYLSRSYVVYRRRGESHVSQKEGLRVDQTKGRTAALWFSTFAMVVSFAVWAVFSPMANTLQELYGLTATEKSLLVATPVLLGSVMRIPLGILTDRWGGRRVYTLMMLSLVIPMVGAGLTDSYGGLLFWAFFIGMAGTTFAIAITYVSRWYPPERQGLVLGIAGMGNFGTAVAGFTVPTLVSQWGISWTFWSWGILIGVTALLFRAATKELPPPKEKKTFKQALSVVRIPETRTLSFFYFLTFGGFVAFGIYLPVLLQDLFHLSSVDAGLRAAGFVVIATLARPVGGQLADRWGAEKVLTVLFAGIFICSLLITLFTDSLILFSVGCLVGAVMFGAGNGAVFKLVPQVAPDRTGAVTGFVGAAGGIGGFFPPILMGMVKDATGGYFLGFTLLSLYALGCLIVNHRFFHRRSHPPRPQAKWG